MAISRERLEELIKEGATIYKVYADVCVTEIKLNKVNFKVDNAYLWQKMRGAFKGCGYPLDKLFETKEDAEWFLEFGNITRTEKLDLPTWEEFNKWDKLVKFYNNSTNYSMYVFIKNKNTNNCRVIIYADDGEQDWIVFEQPLIKENYTLACRKAKELFMGR